jgi:hypothetical protein
MTANQRYRARLRGESVPLLRRKWTPMEDLMIRETHAMLKRGDGKIAHLCALLNATPEQIQARAGQLGVTNSNRKLSNALRTKLSYDRVASLHANPSRVVSNRTGVSTAGYREDIGGQYFRSAWEANYARYLTFTGTRWEYEKQTFWFEKIRRGVRSYTPDFYLPAQKVFHEVKGWMDKKSATKLKRMRIYYPSETVHVIGREFFKQANKQGLCRLIPHWECKHKKHNGTAQLHLTPEHRAKISAALKGRKP